MAAYMDCNDVSHMAVLRLRLSGFQCASVWLVGVTIVLRRNTLSLYSATTEKLVEGENL